MWSEAFIAILAVFVGQSDVDQSAVESIDASHQWQYLQKGWQASRDSLHSGEFQMRAKMTRFKRMSDQPPYGLIDPLPAFNVTAVVAFDSISQSFYQTMTWGRDLGKSEAWIERDGKLFEWSDKDANGFVSIKLVSQPANPSWRKLDPRGFGLFGLSEIESDAESDLYSMSRSWFQDKLRPVRVAHAGDTYTANCKTPPITEGIPGYRIDLVINEAKGFSIEECRYIIDVPENTIPDVAINVEWQEIDDVWVPVKVSGTEQSGLAEWDAQLNWTSVNQTVNPEVFEYEKHESTKDKYVVDARLGQDAMFIVDRVGDKDFVAPSLPTERGASRRISFALIVAVNLLILAGLGRWFYRKTRI